MTSRVHVVCPQYWIEQKAKLKFHRSQIWSEHHETGRTWSLDQASQKLLEGFLIFGSVCPSQPNEISGVVAKQEVVHISGTLSRIKTKLYTWTRDSNVRKHKIWIFYFYFLLQANRQTHLPMSMQEFHLLMLMHLDSRWHCCITFHRAAKSVCRLHSFLPGLS